MYKNSFFYVLSLQLFIVKFCQIVLNSLSFFSFYTSRSSSSSLVSLLFSPSSSQRCVHRDMGGEYRTVAINLLEEIQCAMLSLSFPVCALLQEQFMRRIVRYSYNLQYSSSFISFFFIFCISVYLFIFLCICLFDIG